MLSCKECGEFTFEQAEVDYETQTVHCPKCGEYICDLEDVKGVDEE